jgi:hypothetical protein
MTRKDYRVLAQSLGVAWAIAEPLGDDAVFGVCHAVEQVARALGFDNPRFSLATFEAAVFDARDAELARMEVWSAR